MAKKYLNPKKFTHIMGAYSHGISVDIGDTQMKFKDISAVRNKYFALSKHVSTLLEISKTVKQGCDIEIEVIAVRKK